MACLSVSATGSSGLQPAGEGSLPAGFDLSVSATGSSGLQRPSVSSQRLNPSGFQYPQPDRVVCNELRETIRKNAYRNFQYPQPDRVVCNPRPRFLRPSIRDDLSVSATGSSGLQPPASSRLTTCRLSFSIRNRIEWSATASSIVLSQAHCPFQYPQPDRVVCNARTTALPVQPINLSVSATGSSGLQPAPAAP